MTLSPMEPNVSNNSCPGLESTQGCRLHMKQPGTTAEGPNFLVASQESEKILLTIVEIQPIELIDGHQVFGAVKLPEV
jgi:hypothetical protein